MSAEGAALRRSAPPAGPFGRGPMAGKLLADYLHTGTPAAVLAEADPARRVRELARQR